MQIYTLPGGAEQARQLPLVAANPMKACEVIGCGGLGTEGHHIAPSEIFGFEESMKWPVVELCPPHHKEWHRMIRTSASRIDLPASAL